MYDINTVSFLSDSKSMVYYLCVPVKRIKFILDATTKLMVNRFKLD